MGTFFDKQKRVDYKAKLRRWEFDLITTTIKEVIPKEQIGKLRVLEFGCGPCSGGQYLCQLGHLVATDIYRNSLLSLPPGAEFRIADIHQTDFKESQFDILVSNQCIEHLEDIEKAFQEMKRIGRENAHYAFSIPTATWLVLAIPAKVFNKFENIYTRIRAIFMQSNEAKFCNPSGVSTEKAKPMKKKWLSRFGLGGHGCYPRFFECFKTFRVRNWRRILLSNGFEIVRETSLLTYSASDFPIFPPNRFLAKLGFSSSYLFICKKTDDNR